MLTEELNSYFAKPILAPVFLTVAQLKKAYENYSYKLAPTLKINDGGNLIGDGWNVGIVEHIFSYMQLT